MPSSVPLTVPLTHVADSKGLPRKVELAIMAPFVTRSTFGLFYALGTNVHQMITCLITSLLGLAEPYISVLNLPIHNAEGQLGRR
jgi:hypothetical protein